jgi:MoaA/NifB/PqqE/SkfB family radical SAM enzyme
MSSAKTLGIEIVRGCNFRCRMYPVTAADSDFQFMDLKLLKLIVGKAKEAGSIDTVFFFNFGEPLAHPQFRNCLEIAYNSQAFRNTPVILHTNASLLMGDKAEALLDVRPLGDEREFLV